MANAISTAFFLARHNLKRSSLAVTTVIVVVLAAVFLNQVLVSSLLNGFIEATKEKLVDYTFGHIIVRPGEPDQLIDHSERVIEDLEELDFVDAATARVTLGAKLSTENNSGNFEITFMNPPEDRQVFPLHNHILTGNYLPEDDLRYKYPPLITGIQVAGMQDPSVELFSQSLKSISLDEVVEATFTDGSAHNFQIAGVFDVGYIPPDLKAHASLDTLRKIRPDLYDQASEVNIRLTSAADLKSALMTINRMYPDYQVETWQDNQGIITNIKQSFDIIRNVFSFIALLVGLLFIFVITFVEMVSKRKFIGIQRAIGISEKTIYAFYLIKNTLYATAGIILGMLLLQLFIKPYFIAYPFSFPFGDASLATQNTDLIYTGLIILISTWITTALIVKMQLNISITKSIWGNQA